MASESFQRAPGKFSAAAAPGEDLSPTRLLANYVVSAQAEDLPDKAHHEGVRTFLNWIGCAVGGSRHETMEIAIAALKPFSGPPQATVLGRAERFDILQAALLNGISSHIFDFDDTHPRTAVPLGIHVEITAIQHLLDRHLRAATIL